MNKVEIVKILLKYEWVSFVRNKFQLAILIVTFFFGMYAIYYGKSEIEGQRDTIRKALQAEKEEFFHYQRSFEEELTSPEAQRNYTMASDPSVVWDKHGYHAILHPHDFAALAIGQRDLFRYYYRLTGMSLHYQLFENEIANPVNLLAGNFDLSFVIIYLLPLLIIAFCYGLYSVERESGRVSLLSIQSISLKSIIIVRLGFYFVLITGMAVTISVVGLIMSGNILSKENLLPAFFWISGVIVYCAFWFGLLFLIISFWKSSSFNAMSAVGCWLFFLIVIPSVLNIMVTTKFPLSSTLLADITRRTGIENEDNKQELREVIVEFLTYRPALKGSDSLMENEMLSKAYAAFTSLKDIRNKKKVDHYKNQVIKRNQWVSKYQWINPAVNMQEIFTYIVQTDLSTFLEFQDALTEFHSDITSFYFEKLFWDKPLVPQDYSRLPIFKMPESNRSLIMIIMEMVNILLVIGLFFLLGFIKMKGGYKQ